MTSWIVSDVIERLLGCLAEWNDQGDQMAPFFGGINIMNKVEEALKTVQAGVLDPQRQVSHMFMDYLVNTDDEDEAEAAAAAADAAADAGVAPMRKWLEKVRRILYAMEELFDEVCIAEIVMQKIQSRCHYKLSRSLCLLDSKPSHKRLAQQFESLVGDLLKTHNPMLRVEAGEDFIVRLDEEEMHLFQIIAYLSLFPKAHEFNTTDLIHLWMAQASLGKPLDGNQHLTPQGLPQVPHQYYTVIENSYYFKRKITNEIGDTSYMMTDFGHLFAVLMGGGGCLLVDEDTDVIDRIDNNVHHMSFIVRSPWEAPTWLLDAKHLRSLILLPRESECSITIQNLEQLLSRLTCLRALDLGRADLRSLPDSIGGLKHLRYLKLGGPLQSLPQSITRLHYLQTLDLQACPMIKNLPKNFNYDVTLMLSPEQQFTVDKSKSLDALVGSGMVVGKSVIFFKRNRRRALSEARRADLKSKVVHYLVFEWSSTYQLPDPYADSYKEVSVLKELKPPQCLKSLTIRCWKGSRFPSWERSSPYVNLPHLVSIEIEGCDNCTYLPSFSRLPSLKGLRLVNLKALEYVDNEASSAPYFPSLESLKLEDLPELKEWSTQIQQQVFCQLSQLKIHLCPKLMSMPRAPRLTSLNVEEIHGDLLLHHLQGSPATTLSFLRELKELRISSISEVYSLSVIFPSTQIRIIIKRCEVLGSLKLLTTSERPNMEVEVYNCGRLRHIIGDVGYMEKLKIWRCEELELWDLMKRDDNGDNMGKSTSVGSAAWQDFKYLDSLTVGSITKLNSFPKTLACLSNLRELKIFQLQNLESLPNWIQHLPVLQLVEIVECSNMTTLFVSSDFGAIDLSRLSIRIERCQALVDNLFGGSPISLSGLEFHRCDRLKDISGEELDTEILEIDNCQALHLWEDFLSNSSSSSSTESVGSAAWQGLTSLRHLKLKRILKIEFLPSRLTCLTALEALQISQLPNLRELPEWIGQLSQLQQLEITECPKLTQLPQSLSELTDLQYLIIVQCNNLRQLPEWIGQLSQLQQLEIRECPKVTQLPQSLGQLTNLQYLRIVQCNPELKSRCQDTTGEDWPKIKHIRRVMWR